MAELAGWVVRVSLARYHPLLEIGISPCSSYLCVENFTNFETTMYVQLVNDVELTIHEMIPVIEDHILTFSLVQAWRYGGLRASMSLMGVEMVPSATSASISPPKEWQTFARVARLAVIVYKALTYYLTYYLLLLKGY